MINKCFLVFSCLCFQPQLAASHFSENKKWWKCFPEKACEPSHSSENGPKFIVTQLLIFTVCKLTIKYEPFLIFLFIFITLKCFFTSKCNQEKQPQTCARQKEGDGAIMASMGEFWVENHSKGKWWKHGGGPGMVWGSRSCQVLDEFLFYLFSNYHLIILCYMQRCSFNNTSFFPPVIHDLNHFIGVLGP